LQDGAQLALEVAMGISLAACAGLRTFLPLFVVGVAGRLEWLPLSHSFEWLSSWPALVIFGVAVVTEFLADKIPIVDHLLDLLQVVVKPAAGTVLVAALLTDLSPLQTTVLAILSGGTTSMVMHLTKAKLRLLSTATTAGFGNPVLSFAEDALSLVGSLLAIVVPFVALLVLALGLVVVILGVRRFTRRAAQFGGS
jgi:uncharacterized membrane protein